MASRMGVAVYSVCRVIRSTSGKVSMHLEEIGHGEHVTSASWKGRENR